MGKSLFIIRCLVVSLALCAIVAPQTVMAKTSVSNLKFCKAPNLPPEVIKTVKMWVTAYEPKPEQTDDTPRISASGKEVFDGMVAMNGVPFGTKIRISEIFGDRELEVWDRLHPRKRGVVDIFMEDGAKEFGVKLTNIEILES